MALEARLMVSEFSNFSAIILCFKSSTEETPKSEILIKLSFGSFILLKLLGFFLRKSLQISLNKYVLPTPYSPDKQYIAGFFDSKKFSIEREIS